MSDKIYQDIFQVELNPLLFGISLELLLRFFDRFEII